MATDPTQLLPTLLSVLGQSGNIGQQSQADALANQQNRQAIALNALRLSAAKQQQEQDTAFQHDFQVYYADPTLQNLAALAAKYPQQADNLKKSYDLMREGQRTSAVTQFGSLYNAADAGRADLVAAQLDNIKKAEQAQGIDTSEIDQIKQVMADDPKAGLRYIKGFAQIHLSAAGVDKFQLPTDANHFTSTGDGAIYDQRTGDVVRSAPPKPQYRQIKIIDPVTGEERTEFVNIAEGGDPASGGTGSAGGNGAPRSVRNNNPGNIKDGKFAQGLPGYRGADAQGFAVFANPNAGAMAHQSLLKRYIAGGNNTVASIVSKWAPPSTSGGDNTPQQTQNYIGYVARKLGIDPNDAVTPQQIPKLASAMREFEGGAQSPSNGTQGLVASYVTKPARSDDAPGDTSKTGDDYLATLPPAMAAQVRALSDGRLALPKGAALRSPQVQQLWAAAAQYDPTLDEANAATRVATRKDFTSGKSAQSINAINIVMGHLNDLDHAIDDLHNFDQPLLNRVTGGIAYASGDTRYQSALRNFNAAKNAVARELTRAYRGTGGNVADIRDFDEDLSATDGPAALHATVKKYVQLLGSKIQALGDTYNQGLGKSRDPITLLNSKASTTYRRLSGEGPPEVNTAGARVAAPGGPVRVGTMAEAMNLKPGTLYVAPDGKTRRR